jgi:hypothetical protein
MTIDPDRLQLLVLARAQTSSAPLSAAKHAAALQRFAPADLGAASWRVAIDAALQALIAQGAIGSTHGILDRDALGRRLGSTATRSWAQLTDRVLPGLGLGVAATDARGLERLSGRDAWAAAICARSLGLWTMGPPPTMSALCDQLAWLRLGLAGKPKRLPAEVRALFLQRELNTTPGPTDRLLRLLAARELDVPRTELRVLRDALVRRWLQHATFGAVPAGRAVAVLLDDVRAALAQVHAGTFGDRKVFIAAAWRALRQRPAWAELSLEEFKARLLVSHRAGDLELARADMVAAMDPQLVDESETRSDGAIFHFIIREHA